MKTLDPLTTLGELVTAHPELARELERRGLDYCCGGQRTLVDACATTGLDPTDVASALAHEMIETPQAEWTTMDAAELVDHLETTHHRYLWTEPRITELFTKVVSVHSRRHPELAAIAGVWAEIRSDLEPHLVKEEHVLFPMIRELVAARTAPSFPCGSLRNPISVMLSEHDTVGELLGRVRLLTSGYTTPDDGCASYRACFEALAQLEEDTHLHIHKENNVLFPLVVRIEGELSGTVET